MVVKRNLMTSWKILTLGLWFGIAGALCAADPPSANPSVSAKKLRVILLGDSITAGYGLENAADAYPALLQKKVDSAGLAFTIVNAGVSGDTTAGGLRRVVWAMGKEADMLLIALGGNDGLRGIPAKETKSNLEGIIARARTRFPDIQVILAGMRMPPNFGPEYTREFAAVFGTVAKEQKTDFVPFLLENVGGLPKLNQDDMIHPNPEGQKIVAENVWKILGPLLKPPGPEPDAPSRKP